jgi:hypothetical protein
MIENQPHVPPWMSQIAHNLREQLHDLTKNPEIILPKFDPDKSCALEDHIKIPI